MGSKVGDGGTHRSDLWGEEDMFAAADSGKSRRLEVTFTLDVGSRSEVSRGPLSG